MRLEFPHGLGDCTYFAHQLPLYVRRGHEITVVCNPDKALLFRASGVEISHEYRGDPKVDWKHGVGLNQVTADNVWAANKAAVNLSVPPLPDIGRPQDLWQEFCEVRLDLQRFIPRDDWTAVRAFLDPLPRPIVLLHTKGNSFQESKSLPDLTAAQLYMELLDAMPGTIVLLDWDNRVPRLAHYRVRHLTDDWERAEIPRLMALLYEADLILGIDSGPLHAARFTDTPAIGMFPNPGHYPALYCLPRGRQVNVVPHEPCHDWNKQVRIAFNIIESRPGSELDPKFLAQTAAQMLAGSRYLNEDQLGADVQLQQFVLDWERGGTSSLGGIVDRHLSIDCLLRTMRDRFRRPVIVETGCIRAEEDWRGAGFSTYLLGAYVQRFGGELVSIDNDPTHVDFARRTTRELQHVTVECADSVARLDKFSRLIDVVLLDSWDTTVSGFAEHGLRELQAVLPWLHSRSLILFDDTVYQRRDFHGKGELAVPWLLDHDWEILYSGHQTLLQRRPGSAASLDS